ncbi:DCC1-like thiol-disulfide oxidoreductase family protein [Enemella evansiae]|uniref:DCC1-like thiol-disulfide oxidoreductase family protein n=1 Tax=Enemella evansiae TaxID=2016499 RepID=UPI0010601865|nr:DCC1-like thiol-disulfide oxidoreductase family protein [Enemella evansiae]TDO93594.1 glyoxylase-like metal-dependent hydrolase (beta-lactamase superfamily II) [Enemella evansiae]
MLTVLYDGQCEICQAGVSWIAATDTRRRVRPVAIEDADLAAYGLTEADCLTQLHVIDQTGAVRVGWDAVVTVARALPAFTPLTALDRIRPLHHTADRGYRWIAANRLALSTCRGGSCHVADVTEVRRRADSGAFWSCWSLGLLARSPLIAALGVRDQAQRIREHAATFRKRIVVIPDLLELWFLGGRVSDLVPLAFGERFCAIWYDGALLDPGSVVMRRALGRHLDAHRARDGALTAVTATHAHEEHIGNLEWVADRHHLGVYAAAATSARLRPAEAIPLERALVIGQPPSLTGPVHDAGTGVPLRAGRRLETHPAPGHCADHIVLFDPDHRIALVGDSFMGAYFSSPNAEVDSRAWITTLERLLELDVRVLVEGHGHVHTLDPAIAERTGVVIREDPRAAIEEKLTQLRWLADRIDEAATLGMAGASVTASCFPWGRRNSWETFLADETARLSTRGGFSRGELIRSFSRRPGQTLPSVLEARIGRCEDSPARPE